MNRKRFIAPHSRRRPERFRPEERGGQRQGLLARIQISEAFTWRRTLVMLGLVALNLLPSIWGPRVVPYRLQQILRQPIHSRVDFTWDNQVEAEARSADLRRSFARYYTEVPGWIDQVFDPVYNLLNKAHTLAADDGIDVTDAVKALQAFAAEQKVDVREAELHVLVRELRARWRRLSFYWDIIAPARSVLISKIHAVGILAPADYERELHRPIRVQSNRWGVRTLPPVGKDGPISVEAVPRLLDAYLSREYGRFDLEFRKTMTALLSRRIRPSLQPNQQRSEIELNAALSHAREAAGRVRRGEVLMAAGEGLTATDLKRIRAEAAAHERAQGLLAAVVRLIGLAALLLIAGTGFLLYLVRFEKSVFRRSRELTGVLLLATAVLWGIQGVLMTGLPSTLIPVGVVAGIAALVFGPRVGVGTASLLCFASFIMTETDLGQVISLLGSSWVFCCLAPGVRHRGGLLRAGLLAGSVCFLVTSFWRFASGALPASSLTEDDLITYFGWLGGYESLAWVAGGVFLTIALPTVERIFGAATNVTLLELSDQEHPCLRRLVLEAPGTYHHSVVVGNLAESAAEAIGANPLLARVGSYYHDIGKVTKPEYFTENESGHSRHDNLSPTISTLIIIAHVKDGVEMALAYDLPPDIIDIIGQHHGDSLVGFFYNLAREQAEDPASVLPGAFRYPGPRPQTREAAIVLMADTVEAASRSLTEPTPAHIRQLVRRLVRDKLMSGQLDDSPLTFRNVSRIEESFIRTLSAMFHSRVRYPNSDPGEERRARR